MTGMTYQIPKDSLRMAFVESFADDLRCLGHSVTFTETTDSVVINVTPIDFVTASTSDIRAAYKRLRDRGLETEIDFIQRKEAEGILNNLAEASEINPERIKPELSLCTSRADQETFRYFRLSQPIPTSDAKFRGRNFLIRDVGQSAKPIIGILSFTSAIYSLKARDQYFGWDAIDSRARAKELKEWSLDHLWQLSICMALEPYCYLHGAKLLAMLALSDPIQEAYQSKYGDSLLGLVTTCATGKHTPIFERLKPNQLLPASKYSGYVSEMYKPIGETSETTMLMMSPTTLEHARALSGDNGGGNRMAKGKAIRKAFALVGLRKDVLSFRRKRIYIGRIHENNVSLLRGENPAVAPPVLELEPSAVTEYWCTKWMPKALTSPERAKKYREFRRTEAALSRHIPTTSSP